MTDSDDAYLAWRAAKEATARRRRAEWPASVQAAVDTEGAPTPSLADFRAVYDEDDSVWSRLSCGHHRNLLDDALEELDRARVQLAFERGEKRLTRRPEA